jgi:hypothetical protein
MQLDKRNTHQAQLIIIVVETSRRLSIRQRIVEHKHRCARRHIAGRVDGSCRLEIRGGGSRGGSGGNRRDRGGSSVLLGDALAGFAEMNNMFAGRAVSEAIVQFIQLLVERTRFLEASRVLLAVDLVACASEDSTRREN